VCVCVERDKRKVVLKGELDGTDGVSV
jgi:hypothetical protein